MSLHNEPSNHYNLKQLATAKNNCESASDSWKEHSIAKFSLTSETRHDKSNEQSPGMEKPTNGLRCDYG